MTDTNLDTPTASDGTSQAAHDPRLVTGPKGEVAHVDLIAHSKKFVPRLHRITPRVHHLIGVRSIANCTMIEGETGIVLVDSGSSIDDAEAFLVEFRKVTDKPVVGVIYTHSHYTRGASAYLKEAVDTPIQIWAHERVHHNYTKGRPEIFPTYVRRIATQMGNLCPPDGPDAPPNAGLGGEYTTSAGRYGYVRPTHTVSERTDVEIDGLPITLIPAISDTDDCLTIWLPEERVVHENIFWRVFPNFGAIRGEYYRKPMHWAASVDDIRALEPEHILGCHGVPYSGAAEIEDMLVDYRDAIQFLYDQTIRGLNAGADADELAHAIALPAALAASPVLQEHYGEFAFGVRGICNGVMGWFGTDTATLHPVPKRVEAERIVEGFGGPRQVERKVQASLDEGEFAWAAQLASYLLRVEPSSERYRLLKAQALRRLGQLSRSSITRNYYLTQARELEGLTDSFAIPHRSVAKVLGDVPKASVETLCYQVDPARAEGASIRVGLVFTEPDAAFTLALRHAVLLIEAGAPDDVPTLVLPFDTWAHVLGANLALSEALASGAASVKKGSEADLRAFFAVFDHPNLR